MSPSTPERLLRRWHEVVKVALVGSARGSLDGGGPLPPLAPPGDPEATLLAEAAALALYRRAAELPARLAVPPPAPAPEETQPRCSPGASRLLDGILHGEGRALLPEWLELAARAGLRADEMLLPDLLDEGRQNVAMRPAILRVLGERGRWLAASEPTWRWAVAAVSEGDWATGSRAERLALLAELRATDAARGRELVESTFAGEAAEDRAAFVAALAAGLSDDDEPFLEAALGDRRKEVRTAAATLLARLPRSRLGARMAERALACVSIGPRVEVEPPRAFDAGMARDGLEQTPPRGHGARSFWLRQIVAATPLPTWGPPDRVLAAVRGSDWEELLVGALAVAAARQRELGWAEAILHLTRDLEELLDLLPPERRERIVAADRGRLFGALPHLRHAWSERFSRLVVGALESARVGDLALIAVHLHPVVVAELVAGRAHLPLIDTRLALHKELSR